MEVVASISPVLYQKIAVSQEKNMKVALEKYDVKIVLSSYGLPSLACQSSVDIRTEIGIKWHVLPRFAEKCITSMENTIETLTQWYIMKQYCLRNFVLQDRSIICMPVISRYLDWKGNQEISLKYEMIYCSIITSESKFHVWAWINR